MRPSEVQVQIEAEAEQPDVAEGLPVSPWIGCLGSVLVGLLGAFLVFQVGKLIVQGDLRLAGDSLTPTRLWLVDEAGNRGLGWSTTRIVEGSLAEGRACVQTRVGFLLFQSDGTAKPVTYCECLERNADHWQEVGACPAGASGGGS